MNKILAALLLTALGSPIASASPDDPRSAYAALNPFAAAPQQPEGFSIDIHSSTAAGMGTFPTVVIEHGSVRTVQPAVGLPISVFRRPGSEATPPEQLRVLVLGTGADWKTVAETADNPNIKTHDGHPYDVILGPASTSKEIVDLPRAILEDLDPVEAAPHSRLLLDVLRSETGVSEGAIPLSDLDMHSNGVSIGALLLGPEVAPSHVRAIGPAAGKGGWALDNLVAYSKGAGRMVQIYTDVRDPVFPASFFSIAGFELAAISVLNAFGLDVSVSRSRLIKMQETLSSEGQLEFNVMDMGDLNGPFAEHRLENYLRAIKEGRFADWKNPMELYLHALTANDAQPMGESISFEELVMSLLPTLSATIARMGADGDLKKVDDFFKLLNWMKLPTTDNPVRLRHSYVAQMQKGRRFGALPSPPSRTAPTKGRPSRTPTPPTMKPCSACGGTGHDAAAMAQAQAQIPRIQKLIDEAVQLIGSIPDFVRDSHGNVIVDNRPLKQLKRTLIATWEADKRRLQQPAPCKACGGAGRTRQ